MKRTTGRLPITSSPEKLWLFPDKILHSVARWAENFHLGPIRCSRRNSDGTRRAAN